jgi:hypothetical protein
VVLNVRLVTCFQRKKLCGIAKKLDFLQKEANGSLRTKNSMCLPRHGSRQERHTILCGLRLNILTTHNQTKPSWAATPPSFLRASHQRCISQRAANIERSSSAETAPNAPATADSVAVLNTDRLWRVALMGNAVALSRGQRHAFTAIILAGTHVLLREFPT